MISHLFRRVLEHASRHEELYPLLGVHVELLLAQLQVTDLGPVKENSVIK